MAEGFGRALGRGVLEAWSAGSQPSGKINAIAIEVMKEKNIDLTRQESKGLPELPAILWDYVITMGCGDGCPNITAKVKYDWNIPDPSGFSLEQFRQVRDQIESKLGNLLAEIISF